MKAITLKNGLCLKIRDDLEIQINFDNNVIIESGQDFFEMTFKEWEFIHCAYAREIFYRNSKKGITG